VTLGQHGELAYQSKCRQTKQEKEGKERITRPGGLRGNINGRGIGDN